MAAAVFLAPPVVDAVVAQSNVLLVIADDLGVDMLSVYGLGSDLPATPNLDALAANGIVFRNAWSDPICSPTRATINTGRHGFRTGVLGLVTTRGNTRLRLEEILLPELLDLSSVEVDHALVGKWHLGNCLNGGCSGPNLAGYGHYGAGLLTGAVAAYTQWRRTDNGVTTWSTDYVTTAQIDEAIDWLTGRGGRWFVNLALVAPHAPWEVPPHDLVSAATLARLDDGQGGTLPPGTPCVGALARACYVATIEAMDAELGRLLAVLPPDVTVIFVGDNGTPEQVTVAPFLPERAKGTLYEGGIHVPLIVSGAAVVDPGRESTALTSTSDIFSTVVHVTTGQNARRTLLQAGLPGVVLDSESLLPVFRNTAGGVRASAYAEIADGGIVGTAIRNERYKLISGNIGDELYDLVADPFEHVNLLAAPLDPAVSDELLALRRALFRLLQPHMDDCPRQTDCTACPDCQPTAACTSKDKNVASCKLPDGTLFSCVAGETVHVSNCGCESTSTTTCTDSDATLFCG